MTTARQPWEQLSDESAAAYAHFLAYRNLGVGRTFRRAYRHWVAAAGGATAGHEGPQEPPGSWHREMARFRWLERAEQWDVHVFVAAGEQAVVALVHAYEELARGCVRRMAGRAPKSWDELLRSLEFLARVIPKESIAGRHARLAAAGSSQGGPADSAPGAAPGEGG
jgi:hypothetical protein